MDFIVSRRIWHESSLERPPAPVATSAGAEPGRDDAYGMGAALTTDGPISRRIAPEHYRAGSRRARCPGTRAGAEMPSSRGTT
jgi:hypothetical protein